MFGKEQKKYEYTQDELNNFLMRLQIQFQISQV